MKKGQGEKDVRLPTELYGRIEKRVKDAGFSSVDKYVIFVLEEVLKGEVDEEETAFSEEDEEEVKKRLKTLGYLD